MGELAAAFDEARLEELHRIQHGTESAGFVGLIGDAGTGKSVLLRRLSQHLERQEMGSVYVDLDAAYSLSQLAWLWLRELARATTSPVPFSHLTTLQTSAWPDRTRQAALNVDNALGPRLAQIALSPGPPPPAGRDKDTELVRDAIRATGSVATTQTPILLAIDHLETPSLATRHPVDVRNLLWMIRSVSQRTQQLRVLVAGRPGVEDAFAHERAAFHQDGRILKIARPDREIWERVAERCGDSTVLPEALQLSESHIPTTLALLHRLWSSRRPRGIEGVFNGLASQQFEHANRCLQHARTLNRLGGPIMTAIAREQAPYSSVSHNHPKEVQRALFRLRLAGLVHQKAPRKWGVIDPLVARVLVGGWVREDEPWLGELALVTPEWE